MSDYKNENSGVAFKNDYRKTEKHPAYKGKGNFNGQDFEFGIWVKDTGKGPFLTFRFEEPYKKEVVTDAVVNEVPDEPINLDDIPF